MKKLLLASLLLTLTACGQDKQVSSPSTTIAPVAATENAYSFVRDDRLLDGLYQEIKVVKTEDGTYTATHIITTPGFGAPIETTEEILGTNLECVTRFTPASKVALLTCSHDNRPADGALTVLTLRLKKDGYQARLRTAYWSMIPNTPGFDETKTLVKGLELNPKIEAPIEL